MKLSAVERLTLLNATLPTQGGFLTMTHVENMRKRLNLTPEEVSVLGELGENGEIKQPDFDAVGEKEIEFSDADCTIISEALITMDKKNTLSVEHVSLYEKFVREHKNGEG